MYARIEGDHVHFTIKDMQDGTKMQLLMQKIRNQGLVSDCSIRYDYLNSNLSLEIAHEWVEIECIREGIKGIKWVEIGRIGVEIERIYKSIGEIQQFVEDYLEAE